MRCIKKSIPTQLVLEGPLYPIKQESQMDILRSEKWNIIAVCKYMNLYFVFALAKYMHCISLLAYTDMALMILAFRWMIPFSARIVSIYCLAVKHKKNSLIRIFISAAMMTFGFYHFWASSFKHWNSPNGEVTEPDALLQSFYLATTTENRCGSIVYG